MREEGFVDVGAAVVADEQPLELVEPGEGALDDPAVAAEAGAVLGLAAGDLGFDAASAELAAVFVVVVAAVGDDPVGPPAGPADACRARAAPGRAARSSCVMSLRLPPVSVQASGIPFASTRRWCLEPGRPRSTGLGPVAEPPFSPAPGSNPRPRATTRSRRQRAAPPTARVQLLPHARALPLIEAPPAGRAPSRSRARAADAATRSRCAAQTRSPAAPPDPKPLPTRIAKAPLTCGSSGSTRSHNSSDTTHGATATGPPPS